MTLVLKIIDLINFNTFPEYSEIQDKLVIIEDLSTTLFVSHRWESKHHPDNSKNDIKFLKYILKDIPSSVVNHFDSEVKFEYIWIDYCCIPQNPINHKQRAIKENIIKSIDKIQSKCTTIILWRSSEVTQIQSRAWCFLELVIAVHTKKLLYQPSNNCVQCINFAELFLTGKVDIPKLVATNNSDIAIIEDKISQYVIPALNGRCIIL